MRKSLVTDFLIGTAGIGGTSALVSSTWPAVRKAANTLEMMPGRSLIATVLLPAKAATMSVVRLSSSCFLPSGSMLFGPFRLHNDGLPLEYDAAVADYKS